MTSKFNPRYIPKLIEAKMNKPLSDVCSKLHRLAMFESTAYEDIAAFHAPSECYRDVTRSLERQANQIIAESGFLHREVLAGVIAARTSVKWAHFSSISRFL